MSRSDTTTTASDATPCLMISPAEDFTQKMRTWHLGPRSFLTVALRPHSRPGRESKTADRWRESCLQVCDPETPPLREWEHVQTPLRAWLACRPSAYYLSWRNFVSCQA